MNKLLYSLIILFFTAIGCNKGTTNSKIDDKIYGLASPIQLIGDTTIMLQSDYFIKPVKIDSITTDNVNLVVTYARDSILLINDDVATPLSNINIYTEGNAYSFLVKSPNTKGTTISVKNNDYDELKVKGEFNNWNAENSLFDLDSSLNQWTLNLHCKPGKYQYKLMADNQEINDPSNPVKQSNGMGGYNNVINIEGVPKSELPRISTGSFTEREIIISSENTVDIYAYLDNFRLDSKKKGDDFIISIPKSASNHLRSHIRIFGFNNKAASNDLLIPLDNGQVVTNTSQLNKNDWHRSVMYFIMVDRFVNGDSLNDQPVEDSRILPKAQYYGGDILGVTQKIKEGYFQNLGINTIWISPITQNPTDAWGQFDNPDTKFSGYHGYWPITSTTVDFRLGSPSDVKEMLRLAHDNGISVLLDYVANHVHEQHAVYQQHKDWVTPLYFPDGTMNTENWDSHRLTTWFDTFLPTLNLMDQKISDFMVDSALYWVTEYDFDGFRHDATKHIPLNFWRSLNKRVKLVSSQKGKHIYQIGETYGVPELINSYVGSGLLDAQFDFNMYDNALPVFSQDEESMTRLSAALDASLATYGYHHLMGNISGNQDKPRFVSFADGSLNFDTPWMEYKRIGWTQNIEVIDTIAYKKMAMFNAFNMTIPGIPIVYYGDEIGMAGAGDPDNRRMMRFDNLKVQEANLKHEIAQQIKLRNTNMALVYGDFTIIENTDTKLVYSRKYFDNTVEVVLDKSEWTYSITTN